MGLRITHATDLCLFARLLGRDTLGREINPETSYKVLESKEKQNTDVYYNTDEP